MAEIVGCDNEVTTEAIKRLVIYITPVWANRGFTGQFVHVNYLKWSNNTFMSAYKRNHLWPVYFGKNQLHQQRCHAFIWI